MSSTFETDARLIIGDHWGIYIPQRFCDSMDANDAHRIEVSYSDVLTCQSGPDHPNYWDAWQEILSDARVTDANGRVWRLHQNGDLWEIPDDCEIPDFV